MKFPRYTRKQNLACKLSDKDIGTIRKLYNKGFRKSYIAKVLNVSWGSVHYWSLSKEERKERNRKDYFTYDIFGDREDKKKRQIKSMRRKCKIMNKAFRKYQSYRESLKKEKDKLQKCKNGQANTLQKCI